MKTPTPEDILIRLCLDMRDPKDFTAPYLRMRQALSSLREWVLAKKKEIIAYTPNDPDRAYNQALSDIAELLK